MSRRVALVVAVVLMTTGAALLGRDAYLGLKGALANRLVERALEARLADGDRHRPWAWADFAPLARLSAPRLGVARPVLSGASGESLAFGLGHVDGTAPPGAAGCTVLAGHRDAWGGFLGEVRRGDRLLLESPGGSSAYRIVEMRVVDEAESWVMDPDIHPDAGDRLVLITCYPITGLVATDLRYVVFCERV